MTTSPMVTPQASSSDRPGRVAAPSLRQASYEMGRAGGSCEATRSPLGGKPTPDKPMPAVADGVAPNNLLFERPEKQKSVHFDSRSVLLVWLTKE